MINAKTAYNESPVPSGNTTSAMLDWVLTFDLTSSIKIRPMIGGSVYKG